MANSSSSCCICEACVFPASQEYSGTLEVIEAKRCTVVVAVVIFGHVVVQVVVPALLVNATHAALERREEAFNGHRVDGAGLGHLVGYVK